MGDIARFNPFRSLSRLSPFGREMGGKFKGFFLTPKPFDSVSEAQIQIDISEDEKTFKIRAEMPGFDKDDINISVNGDRVSISAELKKERNEKRGDKVIHRECYYGRQYRSFTLPQAADETNTKARYEDGVLNLELTKKEVADNKKIIIE